MPSCRSCIKEKNEAVSSCIKSRNPLGVIVLVLLIVSSAFVYTAYYITNINLHKPTLQPIPQALSTFITTFSKLEWCLNETVTQRDEGLVRLVRSVNETNTESETVSVSNPTKMQRPKTIFSACLQLIVVIPGDYYPVFRNKSIYRGSLLSSVLFKSESGSPPPEEMISLTYYIQHNLSTSTQHSTEVLVPTYINITSNSALPSYLREASTCRLVTDHFVASKSGAVLPCAQPAPYFHIDQKWEHDLDIYISVDEGRLNIHLMYTSYFLLISAVSVIAYTIIKNRNTVKSSSKAKQTQKMAVVVY